MRVAARALAPADAAGAIVARIVRATSRAGDARATRVENDVTTNGAHP
jgi:hypothetical protein